MKRSLLATAATLLLSTAANAALYTVPTGMANGYLSIRNGPGVNHSLVGQIPAGATVDVGRCVPRDDGIVGGDFCLVNFNGITGWSASSGLLPVYSAAPQAVAPQVYAQPVPVTPQVQAALPHMVRTVSHSFVCFPNIDYREKNPVVKIWVSFNYDPASWQMLAMNVNHEFANGGTVNRLQQYYGAQLLSDGVTYGWSGVYGREPDKSMRGGVWLAADQRWYYRERQLSNGGARTEWDQTSACTEVEG
jgi:uncharacterized protein YraI